MATIQAGGPNLNGLPLARIFDQWNPAPKNSWLLFLTVRSDWTGDDVVWYNANESATVPCSDNQCGGWFLYQSCRFLHLDEWFAGP